MPSVTYSEMAQFIKDILQQCTGIGQVYLNPKSQFDIEDFENLVTTGIGEAKNINVWMITRRGMKNLRRSGVENIGTERREHDFMVTGYYGFNEENNTDKSFQDLLTSICDQFDGKITKASTTSTAIGVEYTSPIEVSNIGISTIGEGYMVHVCSLIVTFQERRDAINYM